jgi:hypothetical protein
VENYVTSLGGGKQEVDSKGKAPMLLAHVLGPAPECHRSEWKRPNVDAGWDAHSGRAGVGIMKPSWRSYLDSMENC